MLSKMARPQVKYNYNHNEVANKDLSKMKLPELKACAKTLEIRVSGTKDELKHRILNHVKQATMAIKIRSLMRRKLVYLWHHLKGTANNCVNESDFYTLEPVDEIPYMYYMQHETNNIKYGFNILSLCSLAIKNKNFENPYTRESMRDTIANKMGRIIKLTNIILPGNTLMRELKNMYEGKDSSNVLHGLFAPQPTSRQRIQVNPVFTRLNSLPMEQRISELFIAIDNLGNYTQKEWLTRMSITQMRYTIIKVYNVWQRIPLETRTLICPQMSPFNRTIMANINNDMSQPEILECLIKMAEVLVYSAAQRDDRAMGAMYFLIGLTMASPDARIIMPWLHDSYYEIIYQNER